MRPAPTDKPATTMRIASRIAREGTVSNNPRTIALVYDAIYPYLRGGAERRFFELAKRLASRGHEVHLYGMKSWDGPSIMEREGLVLHGICKAYPRYTRSGRRSIRQAIAFGLSCLKMVRQRFDVIDCCCIPHFSLFSCKLATLLRRKPLNSTWHEVWGKEYWNEYLGRLGFIGYAVERLTIKLPDHVIAVSEHTAIRLRRDLAYRGRLTVVPNGVDNALIQKVPAVAPRSDVIYVGRLVDNKNVDLLVRAVAVLTSSRPEIQCVIGGDGPTRGELEKRAAALGLQHNIRFLGAVERDEEVYGLMKSSKVFVLPSVREGFGIAVVEANACGIPVITTNHPANAAKDLVTPDNGVIVEPDADAIAGAISTVLSTDYDAGVLRDYAASFDWQALVGEFESSLL